METKTGQPYSPPKIDIQYREVTHFADDETLAHIVKLESQLAAALKVIEDSRRGEKDITDQVYGIIDPDYGRAYTIIRKLAWEEGYAVGLHGSFTRDLDLIAVPWVEKPAAAEHLIKRILRATDMQLARDEPGKKPQGRRVWTLLFKEVRDPRFIDLSVMPTIKEGEE